MTACDCSELAASEEEDSEDGCPAVLGSGCLLVEKHPQILGVESKLYCLYQSTSESSWREQWN